MTNELKRVFTYNGGATAVLKTPLVITDTTAFYRIGHSPRVWIGSTFKVFSDASGTTQYVLGVDYVLDQHYVDIEISKQVGEACYSYLKFIKEARTIYVDMDVVGSHVDGAIINELIENDEDLADAIVEIESDIIDINNKNNEQDLRLSAAETVNNTQNSRLDAAEAFIGAGGVNALSDKAAVANSDLFVIEDSEDGYSKKKVTASQIVSAGGGGGDVMGPPSSVSDDIALFDGVTGKLLKDSGIKIDSLLKKDDTSTQKTTGAISIKEPSPSALSLHVTEEEEAAGQMITFDRYNGVANIMGRRTNGSRSAPSAINNNDVMATFSAMGYDGTSMPSGGDASVQMRFVATQNHSSSAKGTRISFLTMANGETTLIERVSVDSNGITSTGLMSSARGFKNALYAVNWTISVASNKYFYVHQAVSAKRGGSGRVWSNSANSETSNGTVILTPGKYVAYSAALTLAISFSPSQTQSDIITLL